MLTFKCEKCGNVIENPSIVYEILFYGADDIGATLNIQCPKCKEWGSVKCERCD